jgi:hypothetical protein
MGIRYLAVSIDLDDYVRISAGPCPSCGARPHTREPDYGEPEPDLLDLDKSWRYLQRLFDSLNLHAAADLVKGQITETPTGWISYQGTIAPDRVSAMARELATVSVEQTRSLFQENGEWADHRSEEDFDYVRSHLTRAVSFAEKVAHDDRGIVYYIG